MKSRSIVVLTVFLLLFGTWAYADDCGGGWRYADNLDGTITDCRTGLIWLKDANCTDSLGLPGIDKSYGPLTWYDAKKWVAALNTGHCGLNDGSYPGFWRLPTIAEWMAVIASAKSKGFIDPALTNWAGDAKWTNGNPFFNVLSNPYWSTTAAGSGIVWVIFMVSGDAGMGSKWTTSWVWPVRAGQVTGNDASFGTVRIE